MIHLTQRDGRIQVAATPVRAVSVTRPGPDRPAVEKQNGSAQAQMAELLQEFAELEQTLRPLVDRKSELLQRTQEPGFYKNPAARAVTFDEIQKLDQFLTLRSEVGKGLQNLNHRVGSRLAREQDGPSIRERIEGFRAALRQLQFVGTCSDARDLGDALLILSLVERAGSDQHGVERLTAMYAAFARRYGMSVESLGEQYDEKHDRVCLLVSGLGAFALLKNESGLHQLDYRFRKRTPRSGRETTYEDRESVRVETLPANDEPDSAFRRGVKARVVALKTPKSRLLKKADLMVSLFHEPSLRSLELWMTGPKNAALDRAYAILHAQLQFQPDREVEAGIIIRHYDLGLSPKVKDVRSGKSTTRVDRVLKGYLEALIN